MKSNETVYRLQSPRYVNTLRFQTTSPPHTDCTQHSRKHRTIHTFGYPLIRPDLNRASLNLRANILRSLSPASWGNSVRSMCSKTVGTPEGLLLALRATAATMYHGFESTVFEDVYMNSWASLGSRWDVPLPDPARAGYRPFSFERKALVTTPAIGAQSLAFGVWVAGGAGQVNC